MDLVISHPISWHLRRGGMGRVGGARRQALHRLRPRHRQRAGGGCSAERWLPWSRAWTCCSGCCASSESRPIGSHWIKSARRGGLCSPCRQSADATWTRKHGSSTWLGWHLGLKYGLGVQDGFMLETASGCQWVKEEGEAGEYLYSHQYLKTWILSPSLARRRPPPQTYNEGYLQRPLVRCWKVYI